VPAALDAGVLPQLVDVLVSSERHCTERSTAVRCLRLITDSLRGARNVASNAALSKVIVEQCIAILTEVCATYPAQQAADTHLAETVYTSGDVVSRRKELDDVLHILNNLIAKGEITSSDTHIDSDHSAASSQSSSANVYLLHFATVAATAPIERSSNDC
jgi:hypothetical protein